jgi:cytidylate kinase
MIITIGGSIGSGKSTLAEAISKRFNYKHISAGKVMRDMAEEKGISLLEFSKYAEKHPEIDKEIDRRQKEQAKNCNCVIDGRISAYIMPADLCIWLDAPLDIRAARVSKREKISVKDALEGILRREGSEKKRYKEIYKIDLTDHRIYDLIVNTKRINVEEMTDLVSEAIKVFNQHLTN